MKKFKNSGQFKKILFGSCHFCDRPAKYAKPVPACHMHYQRYWRTGKYDGWTYQPYIAKTGYLMIQVPKRGKIAQHRYFMELHLGRRLRTDEHIHHINGNKTDNRIENLKIMSHSEHSSFHFIVNNPRKKHQ